MGKRIEKEREEIDANIRGLGKSKPEDFEAAEDGFHNLLSQETGTTKADHNKVVLEVFPDVAMERMYQIQLSGDAFGEDNQKSFRMLKEYLIKSLYWAWIEPFDATENNCEAFWAGSDH